VGTTTATGELAVMGGKFKAYTRELEVEKGRLLFAGGPLADPGLDLRASRQFPGVKAGVLVRGTLRRPLVRFFSDPARTQNEIASLLVVGRSLEGAQGTSGGTNTLASATAKDAALQQGGALLAAQLGRYVGLDEVQLERDQNDAASLVLGKYLSPRLYVSYGVGLTAALSALKLRYTLGNRWVIKTEAGSRQSVDLEYTTED
jgi:translocation and assembly module TamB